MEETRSQYQPNIPPESGQPIQELVTERDLWREEKNTPEWQALHDKTVEAKKNIRDILIPKSDGNPLAERTYYAAENLAGALNILLEEPDSILAPERNMGSGPEPDQGSARWPFARRLVSTLDSMGFSVDDIMDQINKQSVTGSE